MMTSWDLLKPRHLLGEIESTHGKGDLLGE